MIDVDVWVRGRQDAATEKIAGISQNAASWTDVDVKKLLEGMLLALERVNNPGGIPPEVTLRGFSWIVSPDNGGVLLHLEMQLGTVSAGPFAIDEHALDGHDRPGPWRTKGVDVSSLNGNASSLASAGGDRTSARVKRCRLAFPGPIDGDNSRQRRADIRCAVRHRDGLVGYASGDSARWAFARE